jgi:trk system potassium uptake protein TrkH
MKARRGAYGFGGTVLLVTGRVQRLRTALQHPARLIATGYFLGTLVGTVVLMTPFAAENGRWTGVVDALFTATSAICVTGMTVVDTGSHWSTFGEVAILCLAQAGGLGIMTVATLVGLVIARRVRLRLQMVTQAESRSLEAGDIGRVLFGIVKIAFVVQTAAALMIAVRYWTAYDVSLHRALYFGFFHGITAFNNAGFGLLSDNLISFASDPFILFPIAAALVIGGLGFPVLFEIGRHLRRTGGPARWTLHARVTLLTYFAIMAIGIVLITALEWSNSGTLGPLSVLGKLTSGAFQGISPRTAGFNSIDYAEAHSSTLLITDVMMFIGGGSAGTAGGIKVTTFALLAFVIWAEVKGHPTVHAFNRKVPAEIQRQAITIALLSVAAVMLGTIAVLLITNLDLDVVLFESISAFSTVGLTTGITPGLPDSAKLVLVALMFIGRLGPVTLASALALRERTRRYELPEERPLVG